MNIYTNHYFLNKKINYFSILGLDPKKNLMDLYISPKISYFVLLIFIKYNINYNNNNNNNYNCNNNNNYYNNIQIHFLFNLFIEFYFVRIIDIF